VLYSFGGYGFWRSSNILTEYDFQNGEWRSIRADGDIPKTINMSPSGYFPKKDRFVTMANEELNDTENKPNGDTDWNVYEYNFEQRKFTIAGEIKLEILKNYLTQDLSKHYIQDGRYFSLSIEPINPLIMMPCTSSMCWMAIKYINGKSTSRFHQ